MIRLYTRIIETGERVLYLKGAPGTAKSAIAADIARIQGWNLIDIRLSLFDECEIIGLPDKEKWEQIRVMNYLPPKWAAQANKGPTLIFFDEINRARLQVLNSCLQLWSYKRIGTDFKFNGDVYMMAAGNLGFADACDVIEFDSATEQRMFVVEHSLTYPMWVEGFAKNNINPVILDYLKDETEKFIVGNVVGDNTEKTVANPRTWTNLSNYLKDSDGNFITKTDEIMELIGYTPIGENAVTFGHSFIGITIFDFINWLGKRKHHSLQSVISGKMKKTKVK